MWAVLLANVMSIIGGVGTSGHVHHGGSVDCITEGGGEGLTVLSLQREDAVVCVCENLIYRERDSRSLCMLVKNI